MVSRPGSARHRAPTKRIPQLRRCGTRFVSITGEGSSFLRDNADALLAILGK